MKIKTLVVSLSVIGIIILSIGCANQEQTETTFNLASFIDSLEDTGASVIKGGELEQPFFSVKGSELKVNGSDVQVFEYKDQAAAESEADLVSPNGNSIGGSSPFWVGPPHFYKKGRLIVLYIGENSEIISLLTDSLGNQFAGQ